METKFCIRCEAEKPLGEFYRQKTTKDNLNSWCKKCKSEYNAGYREEKPKTLEEYKNARYYLLKCRYGISREEYDKLLKEQGGVCAICKQDCYKRLSVDHCHKTGVVRGLLCQECNIGIGKLGDNYEGVKKALDYLEKFECDES